MKVFLEIYNSHRGYKFFANNEDSVRMQSIECPQKVLEIRNIIPDIDIAMLYL
ncbi:MAG: hypothetical protein IJ529_03730 [Alphaproteobacteria bacterium]|nr:hypothetical protein [Alphaproteobacteria bacterium]